jgi:hypothetical protein
MMAGRTVYKVPGQLILSPIKPYGIIWVYPPDRGKTHFGKRDFIYHPEDDEYECPAGESAIHGGTSIRHD